MQGLMIDIFIKTATSNERTFIQQIQVPTLLEVALATETIYKPQ